MSFKIEKIESGRKRELPEGHYIFKDGIDWQIYELNISASGRVCMKIWDPIRKEHQLLQLCSIEELVAATVPDVTYQER